MKITIELPDDVDLESVNLRDLWCDAIYEFSTRRRDAKTYVEKRYVNMGAEFIERKTLEVAWRSSVAAYILAWGKFTVEE